MNSLSSAPRPEKLLPMPPSTKSPKRTGPQCRKCEEEGAGTLRARLKDWAWVGGFTLSEARQVEEILSSINMTAYFTPMSKKLRRTKGKKWLLTLCEHGETLFDPKHNRVRGLAVPRVGSDHFLFNLALQELLLDQS